MDVTKDDIPKDQEETQDDKNDEGKDDKHGTEVSSDEEGEGDDERKDQQVGRYCKTSIDFQLTANQ